MLSNFSVVPTHQGKMGEVLVHAFNGRKLVLVFVERAAIDDYFQRRDLTQHQRNLLVGSNLAKVEPVIGDKYERGEVGTYTGTGGMQLPCIDLTLADLRQVPERLSDVILYMDARAGFQRV